MADSHAKDHDYHLVEPSPWPALGALSALVLAGGLVMYMHDMTVWVLPIGLAMMLYTMFVWWRDVIQEATFKDDHTPVVQLGLRYGMVLFIASEVMFFVAWFWAFFNASLFPTEAIGGRPATSRPSAPGPSPFSTPSSC
jgi:cytochrome c oxidase subunit 3